MISLGENVFSLMHFQLTEKRWVLIFSKYEHNSAKSCTLLSPV